MKQHRGGAAPKTENQILASVKKYRKWFVIGPIFKLIEAIFELLIPTLMVYVIDRGVSGRDGAYVLKMIPLMAGIAVLGYLSALVCQYVASLSSQGFGTELRDRLFKHLLSIPQKDADRLGTPTMVNRVTTDVNILQQAVAMLIRLAIRAPFICVGSLVMAAILNLKLTLVILCALPFLVAAVILVMRVSVPLYTKVQQKLDNIAVISRENYKGLLWPLPIGELLFVGKSGASILKDHGILTIGDLAQADPASISSFLEEGEYDALHTYFNTYILPLKSTMNQNTETLNNLMNVHVLELKSLLSVKLMSAMEQGIQVTIDIPDTIDQIQLNPIDLTRVLGIYLDNAMEAASETERPVIAFHMAPVHNCIAIMIANSFLDKGLPISEMAQLNVTSKGENHGIGLYNANQILNQYDTVFHETYIEDGQFIQHLQIQNS